MPLVGYFDILGTRDAVLKDEFSDLMILDFVAPVGIAAGILKTIRYAVLSDCVIFSCEDGHEKDFIKAVSIMCGQWSADLIQVRGGIASGEIRWVDYEHADALFSKFKNLMYARLYGKALVKAHEIEQKSGPGAIIYVSDSAAELIANIEQNAILSGITPSLCWATEREAKLLERYSHQALEYEKQDSAGQRHALATKRYWELVCAKQKYLPLHLASPFAQVNA